MKQNCDTAMFKKRHLMRFYTRQNWNRPPTGVYVPGQWTQHTSTKAQSQFRGDTRAHVKLARWHFTVPTILAGCRGGGRRQNRAQVWWFYWGSTNTRRGVKKSQSLSIFFSWQTNLKKKKKRRLMTQDLISKGKKKACKMFSPSFKKTDHQCHHHQQLSVCTPDRRTASVFAICWGGARTWAGPGPGPGARTWAGLFVWVGEGGPWARPGRGLWAGLGPRGGPAGSLAPTWRLPLWGATEGPGAAPGAVAAPGPALGPGVASGAGAALAVAAESKDVIVDAAHVSNVLAGREQYWLSAVLKDLQLPSIQLCPIKLGDGALHVTAGCKLHHPAADAAVTTEPPHVSGQQQQDSPFIFVGPVGVHKGNFTCFPHHVLQVLLESRALS